MEFKVPGMSCGHCTAAIEKSIKSADPSASVNCDIGQHLVRIESSLGLERLSAAIKDAGYESEPVTA